MIAKLCTSSINSNPNLRCQERVMSWRDYGWLDRAAIISACFSMVGIVLARIAIELAPGATTFLIVFGLWLFPALLWLLCTWSVAAHTELVDVCKVIGGLTFLGLFADPLGALVLGIALVPFSAALGLLHVPARALLNIGRSNRLKL